MQLTIIAITDVNDVTTATIAGTFRSQYVPKYMIGVIMAIMIVIDILM